MLTRLPPELIALILFFCDNETLKTTRLVSKAFDQVAGKLARERCDYELADLVVWLDLQQMRESNVECMRFL